MQDFEYQITNLIFASTFELPHISVETYRTCDFQGEGGPDPLPSFGSAHAFSLKLSSHTYVFFTQY